MTEKRERLRVQNIVLIAVFVALMAVCSWITIPFGTIPVTLQTLGVFVTAGLLGLSMGTGAVIVYIFIGIIGIPVFSGFAGGIERFIPYSETGATGGYIIGFVFTAMIIGIFHLFSRKLKNEWMKMFVLALGMLIGDAVCFFFGTAWFTAFNPWGMNLKASIITCVVPFIIPDLIKIVVATIVVNRVKRYIRVFD